MLSPAPAAVPVAAPQGDADKKTADAAKAAEALKAEGAKAADAKGSDASKPGVIPATIFLNVTPWGEVFVNGRSQGVSPPKKFLKLDPGKYKVEIRNTTFPVHVENVDLKARDEITLRHRFQ